MTPLGFTNEPTLLVREAGNVLRVGELTSVDMGASAGAPLRPARIVSGGQNGADRGALHAAQDLGIPIGGWCPLGGWAEDVPEPPGVRALFPELVAVDSSDPAVRTRANVSDSDATLIVVPGGELAGEPGGGEVVTSTGTSLTHEVALELLRPVLVVDPGAAGAVRRVRQLMGSLAQPVTLNVAGPRESESPGLAESTRRLLLAAFGYHA